MKLKCCVVTRQNKTPRLIARPRERSSATQHLHICLKHLIESWMTHYGCIPMRKTNFLCLCLNPSTARRESEGGILFSVSCLVRRNPEPCVLHARLKALTQRIMRNLTSTTGCTPVLNGEHTVSTTLVMVLVYITLLFLIQSLSLCPTARPGPSRRKSQPGRTRTCILMPVLVHSPNTDRFFASDFLFQPRIIWQPSRQ